MFPDVGFLFCFVFLRRLLRKSTPFYSIFELYQSSLQSFVHTSPPLWPLGSFGSVLNPLALRQGHVHPTVRIVLGRNCWIE